MRQLRWLALLFVLALGAVAIARPGGGHSYSGGHSSSSHSSGGHSSGGGFGYSSGGGGYIPVSGDGGSEMLYIFLMIALAIVVAVVRAYMARNQGGWSAGVGDSGDDDSAPESPAPSNVGPGVEQIRADDPDFSFVLFQDFLYSLYADVHTARGNGTLARLSPYVNEAVLAELAATKARGVQDIVVGAMTLSIDTNSTPDYNVVIAAFEANYTESGQSYYTSERWALVRKKSARTKPPKLDAPRSLGCPNCGGSLDAIQGNVCSSCKQIVDTGEFDWLVQTVSVDRKETRGPMLTSETAESGTDLPTIVDPDFTANLAALQTRDPALNMQNLSARLQLIFSTLQTAWSARDLKKRARS